MQCSLSLSICDIESLPICDIEHSPICDIEHFPWDRLPACISSPYGETKCMRGPSGTEKCAPNRPCPNQTLRAPRVSAASSEQTGPTAQLAPYKHAEPPPPSAPPPSQPSQQSRARKGAVESSHRIKWESGDRLRLLRHVVWFSELKVNGTRNDKSTLFARPSSAGPKTILRHLCPRKNSVFPKSIATGHGKMEVECQ